MTDTTARRSITPVAIDIRPEAVATVLHALDLAIRRGSYTSAERARLQEVHDDLTLRALEPQA